MLSVSIHCLNSDRIWPELQKSKITFIKNFNWFECTLVRKLSQKLQQLARIYFTLDHSKNLLQLKFILTLHLIVIISFH